VTPLRRYGAGEAAPKIGKSIHRRHPLVGERAFPVRELNRECYIHRMNCEFVDYASHILKEKGVTCTATYWSERNGWAASSGGWKIGAPYSGYHLY